MSKYRSGMIRSANETLDSSLRNLVGKFFSKLIYQLFFKTKIQLAVFLTSRIIYLNVFGATLHINIHVLYPSSYFRLNVVFCQVDIFMYIRMYI